MARSSKTTPVTNQTSIRAFGQGNAASASANVTPGSGTAPSGGSAPPATAGSPAGRHQASANPNSSTGQTVGATATQPATSSTTNAGSKNPYRSSRSTRSTSQSSGNPPPYVRTSPAIDPKQRSASSTKQRSTAHPNSSAQPITTTTTAASANTTGAWGSASSGPTFASLAQSNAPSGSSSSANAASTESAAFATPNPNATSDRLRPEGVEQLNEVDSDAEVSTATSSLLNDSSRLNIVLQDPSTVGSLSEAKTLRLLYGNARTKPRCCANQDLTNILDRWYGQSVGRSKASNARSNVDDRCTIKPRISDVALFDGICGVLYFVPPRESEDGYGSLCLLRAPIDYSPPAGRESLYGLVGNANCQTRFSTWTPAEMWQHEASCTKITFNNEEPWDKLVVTSTLLSDRCLGQMAYAENQAIYEAMVRSAWRGKIPDAPDGTPLPIINPGMGKHEMKRILLPRVFPVPDGGDIPGDLELFLGDDISPRDSIATWRGVNGTDGNPKSITLDAVLSSPAFAAWVGAIMMCSHPFTTTETDFWPRDHSDRYDCTAALLVSRRLSFDIVHFCTSKAKHSIALIKKNFSSVDIARCRNPTSLTDESLWPPPLRCFARIPPLLTAFPNLIEHTPIIDVDQGDDSAEPQQQPEQSSDTEEMRWRAPTPIIPTTLPSPRPRPSRPIVAAPPLRPSPSLEEPRRESTSFPPAPVVAPAPPHREPTRPPTAPVVAPAPLFAQPIESPRQPLSWIPPPATHQVFSTHEGYHQSGTFSSSSAHDNQSGRSSRSRLSPTRDPVAAFNAIATASPGHASVISSPATAFRSPPAPFASQPQTSSTDYWRTSSVHPSVTASSLSAPPPVAIDASSLPSRGFFGIEPRVPQVSSPYGGAVVTGDGILNPSLPPQLVRLPRFSFLGALSPPGRVGHMIHPNIIFRPEGTRMAFAVSASPSDAGPYLVAPPSTVLLPDFDSNFVASFPLHGRIGLNCVHDMARRFEYFIDSGNPRAIALLLRPVSVECGFFSERTILALQQGTVFSNDLIPSIERLEQTISVFSFLRFREGPSNEPRLPAAGWSTVTEAQRFIAALQWFVLDLFGPTCGQATLFFRSLDAMRRCLELPSFVSAWDSIPHKQFSFFIVYQVHRLWVMMSTWEAGAEKKAIYYMPTSTVLKIRGAAPFTESRPTASIDVFLNEWLGIVENRFPHDPIDQVNAFKEVIPLAWETVFLPPDPMSPSPSADGSPPRDRGGRGGGNPTVPLTDRRFTHCILERVPGPDAGRKRVKSLLRAVSPIPAFRFHNGKYIDLCFGQNVTGLGCVDPANCERAHLDIRKLRTAPRNAVADIISWLEREPVRTRIRLTRAARELNCFQGC